MAMYDALLVFCKDKEIKAAFQSDAIDFRQTHPTSGALQLFLNLSFPVNGAGTGSVTFTLQDSADGSSDWKDVLGFTLAATACTGDSPQAVTLPVKHRRYLRLATTLSSGAAITAGKVTAFINDGYDLIPLDKKQGVTYFPDATA